MIYLEFPSDLSSPLATTFISSTGVNLKSNLTHKLYGQYGIYIKIEFKDDRTSLPANVDMIFDINGVHNPMSTKPTSLLTAIIYDSEYNEVNSFNTSITTFLISIDYPNNFTGAEVSHESAIALENT